MRESSSGAHLLYRAQALLRGLAGERYGRFTDRSHSMERRVRLGDPRASVSIRLRRSHGGSSIECPCDDPQLPGRNRQVMGEFIGSSSSLLISRHFGGSVSSMQIDLDPEGRKVVIFGELTGARQVLRRFISSGATVTLATPDAIPAVTDRIGTVRLCRLARFKRHRRPVASGPSRMAHCGCGTIGTAAPQSQRVGRTPAGLDDQ